MERCEVKINKNANLFLKPTRQNKFFSYLSLVAGTAGCMAPEIASGEYTVKSEILFDWRGSPKTSDWSAR